jgi:hypothetical protein
VLDPPSLKHVSTIARTVITPNTGVGTTNLAFGKHATQSSRYPYSILTVAGYAVDGNTDGKISDGNRYDSNSSSSTNMISADCDKWI